MKSSHFIRASFSGAPSKSETKEPIHRTQSATLMQSLHKFQDLWSGPEKSALHPEMNRSYGTFPQPITTIDATLAEKINNYMHRNNEYEDITEASTVDITALRQSMKK